MSKLEIWYGLSICIILIEGAWGIGWSVMNQLGFTMQLFPGMWGLFVGILMGFGLGWVMKTEYIPANYYEKKE